MSDASVTSDAPSNREAALKGLYDDIHQGNMFPFWATSTDVAHDEVQQLMATSKAVPYVWKYTDIEPILQRAAKLISMDDSERRSLILVNPGLSPKRASVSTMYTAYRLNDPDEIMPPHKHSPSAIRFGLTGQGNFTGVDGENITFGPGDMVLTPNDTWHNHGTVGGEQAVNLSVLDLPLVETLHAVHFDHHYTEIENGKEVEKKVQTPRFSENYSQEVYGQGGMMPRFVDHRRNGGFSSPMYVYRWEAMEELLDIHKDADGDPHEGIVIDYTDPVTGGPVFKTINFYVQMLRPGEKTLPQRETASLLLAPFRGKGYSIIDGDRHNWDQFDTIAIPGGCWVEHVNESPTEPVIFFGATDAPTQKALLLYKRWGRNQAGDLLRLG
ncbi:cupin domain-containing protein [Amorphus orientalis]|uniref:Gentisate 1,2-dioxygenase n=1 Tax=Amorphus orientalis TaxID=649198 RepID=A0AAE3VT05_9HYPH|nr:cupin domain-containing protein [Amorphus orientalis]MDQ0317418.1 gentisate 1,2-dioxygenase [Amorphus orientalis]